MLAGSTYQKLTKRRSSMVSVDPRWSQGRSGGRPPQPARGLRAAMRSTVPAFSRCTSTISNPAARTSGNWRRVMYSAAERIVTCSACVAAAKIAGGHRATLPGRRPGGLMLLVDHIGSTWPPNRRAAAPWPAGVQVHYRQSNEDSVSPLGIVLAAEHPCADRYEKCPPAAIHLYECTRYVRRGNGVGLPLVAFLRRSSEIGTVPDRSREESYQAS
jgi:hypothetical protein